MTGAPRADNMSGMPLTTGASTAPLAAAAADVEIADLEDAEELAAVETLLAEVWGTPMSSPPIPLDLLRSFAHSGGQVAAARHRPTGELAGAAVAIGVPGRPETYSLIAGVRSGRGYVGVGFALKQHQRAWSLDRGNPTMRWTFDPLVRRNAWFNLGRLGAEVDEYCPEFFGAMHDAVNHGDLSDRLVVRWRLDEPPEGEIVLPDPGGTVVDAGPDGDPAVLEADGVRWVRTPDDVVALRTSDPAAALAWRTLVRRWLAPALAQGAEARFHRDGWYCVEGRGA